jgi:hypothetical protein
MQRLNEFHNGIIEAEEPIKGNTLAALYKWLKDM